jgi:hypothetical protein
VSDNTHRVPSMVSSLPLVEIYRLAGERLAELAPEVDSLRAEVYSRRATGALGAEDAESELREAESRMDGCRHIMERAQQRIDAEHEEDAGSSMEAAWTAATSVLALASRETRDLMRRRAEFSLELYVQERMTPSEADLHQQHGVSGFIHRSHGPFEAVVNHRHLLPSGQAYPWPEPH